MMNESARCDLILTPAPFFLFNFLFLSLRLTQKGSEKLGLVLLAAKQRTLLRERACLDECGIEMSRA